MMRLALLMLLALAGTANARSRAAEKFHKQAQQAFDAAQYERAADLSQKELEALEPNERELELEVRERHALSLFLAGRKIEAKAAHKEMLRRFPAFRFDADRVGPDVAQFFEPPVTHQPASVPAASAPVVIKPPPPPPPASRWRWYYLAPLGVGQFLADSPVRGAIFVALELGFLAANLAGYLMINAQRIPGGVRDVRAANSAQIVMDVGFFGAIASFAGALIDGIAFEP